MQGENARTSPEGCSCDVDEATRARIPDVKPGVRYRWHPRHDALMIGSDGSAYSFRVRGSHDRSNRLKIGYKMLDKWCKGYPAIFVAIEYGKTKLITRHTLVLETFISPRADGMEASHLDGNRLNPNLSNLVWESRKDNHRRKIEHGTAQRGENSGNAKLTLRDVIEIKARLASGESPKDISKFYGVVSCTISAIKHKRLWRHVQ